MNCDNLAKNSKINHCIFFVRLITCLLLFLTLAILKLVNKNYEHSIKSWIKYQLNDSLIVNEEPRSNDIYTVPYMFPKILANISNPVEKGCITSTFGIRTSPFNKNIKKLHKGIDIGANYGDSIFAVLSGSVEYSGTLGDYGKCVIIDHGNRIKTLYAHCNNLDVLTGDYVNKNQKIASVGSTGLSTGSHLHIELMINNTNYDPALFLTKKYDMKNENKNI